MHSLLLILAGYEAFYSFCRVRGGYSGVVTFVRSGIPTPRAEEGLTGAWKTETPVGHVGELHLEVRLIAYRVRQGIELATDSSSRRSVRAQARE